jgi:predicted chitinase
MLATTLAAAMPGLPLDRAEQLVGGCNRAMAEAQVNNVLRASMWLAQTGEETGSLQAATEYASGAEYEGRADLGNVYAGDGELYKGRGFIQVTGRANYTALSQWAYARGDCPTASYFVDHPDELATDRYVWLGVVWFWTSQHFRDTTPWRYLNDAADHQDVQGATYIVNGGLNGYADRLARWNHCLTLGTALLPIGNIAATLGEDDMDRIFRNTEKQCSPIYVNGGRATTIGPTTAANLVKAGVKVIPATDADYRHIRAWV